MAYFTDLFSPETYEAFSESDRLISGFRETQQSAANRVRVGDKLVCYMTKVSRWVGLLEVTSEWFRDDSPIFLPDNDPFVIRFRVRPIAWLDKSKLIPIREDSVWNVLSFTKDYDKATSTWTGKLRSSLNALTDEDGKFLEQAILRQLKGGVTYELNEQDYEKLLTHRVRRDDKVVSVSVPSDHDPLEEMKDSVPDVRESIKVQALLASIGAQMGMKIWIPKNDRSSVLSEWKDDQGSLLETLPLNHDETTLKTIEQIDVIWLRRRSIVRAFEVEHTTSIYSGILRMADLLALQPNMDIKLHIVAPTARREKVFQELRRPIFSFLDRGPLSESCKYMSYENVEELSREKHLSLLSDRIVDEYAEEAE